MPKHDVFPALTKCFSFLNLTRSYAEIQPKEKQGKKQQQNVKMQHKEFFLSVDPNMCCKADVSHSLFEHWVSG